MKLFLCLCAGMLAAVVFASGLWLLFLILFAAGALLRKLWP